jgi:hypothetical protein
VRSRAPRRRGIAVCPSGLVSNWGSEFRKWVQPRRMSMGPLLIVLEIRKWPHVGETTKGHCSEHRLGAGAVALGSFFFAWFVGTHYKGKGGGVPPSTGSLLVARPKTGPHRVRPEARGREAQQPPQCVVFKV